MNFEKVQEFENQISKFFGSIYAVAVDSCTHGIELCLRYTNTKKINVPKRTYLSVPFLAEKTALDCVATANKRLDKIRDRVGDEFFYEELEKQDKLN